MGRLKMGPMKVFFPFPAAVAVLALVLACLTAPLAARESPKSFHCITEFKNGKINWSTGTVTAIGKAAPRQNKDNTHEAVPGLARADANRRIIGILKQIRIHNTLAVAEYASKNDVLLAGIEKTARDAVIRRQYYTSALDVEVAIETSLFGGFLQMVLPEEIRQIPKINPEKTPDLSMEMPPYTGLILDVRGLSFEPVLYPVIVSEQGREIYSALYISREFAVQYGVCKYLCSMDRAMGDNRIGHRPLVFKALRKSGKENTAVVISEADTKKIEKATERHLFLKECRVIFVTGD